MKKLFWITYIVLSAYLLHWSAQAYAGGQTKEVCKDVIGKDGKAAKNKDGSTKQTCKKIKVHKKLEGTEVPVKKK
jgi:hypothetical protein